MLPNAKVQTAGIKALLKDQIAAADFFLIYRFRSSCGCDTLLTFCDSSTNNHKIDGRDENEKCRKKIRHLGEEEKLFKLYSLKLLSKEFNE
jgi:hypothetical protein